MRIVTYKCDSCGKETDAPIKIFPELIDTETCDFLTMPDDEDLIPIRQKDFCRQCVKAVIGIMCTRDDSIEDSLGLDKGADALEDQ